MNSKKFYLALSTIPFITIGILFPVDWMVNHGCGRACFPESPLGSVLSPLQGPPQAAVTMILFTVSLAVFYWCIKDAITESDTVQSHDTTFDDQKADLTSVNQQEVDGWQYGLKHGVITDADMCQLDSAQIQTKLDLDNPSSAQIFVFNNLIPTYESAKTLSLLDRQRLYRMQNLRRELRQHPEALHLKVLSTQADEAIADAQQEAQSVRDLPEG